MSEERSSMRDYCYKSLDSIGNLHPWSPEFRRMVRDLRKNMTDEEKLLWEKLRRKQLGFRFNRQFPVAGYILDFYCRSKHLGVEVDGKIHLKKDIQFNDLFRSRRLSSLGIRIIRFTNEEVLKDIDDVLVEIMKELER